MLVSPDDDWTHNAFEIQRIKKRNPAGDTVVFIGGSVLLEAITSDQDMRERLGQLLERPIDFRSLAANNFSYSDNAKVIKALGNVGGTYLIMIYARNFRFGTDFQLIRIFDPDFQLVKEKGQWIWVKKERDLPEDYWHLKYFFITTPPEITKILMEKGLEPGLTHMFNLFRTSRVLGEIIKKRGMRFIFSKGKERRYVHNRHFVGDRIPVTESQRVKYSNTIKQQHSEFLENKDFNLALLEKGIRLAQSSGNRIILVDMPHNPLFRTEHETLYSEYDDMIIKLVDDTGVGYIDMREAADWETVDFRDVHHMRISGQKKFTEALALRLKGCLENKERVCREE